MPIPPWAVELLRRSVTDVASKTNPETIDRLRSQATAILNDLPAAAARTVDSVMSATETRRESVRAWAKSYTSKSRAVVNASGVLIGSPAAAGRTDAYGDGTAIDTDVLEAGMEFFDGSRIAGPGLQQWLQSVAAKMIGDVTLDEPIGMVITNRLSSAVALVPTLSQLPLCLHRSHAVMLPGGGNVPDLAKSLGFGFEEFGSISGTQATDYDGRPAMTTVFVGDPPAQRMIGDGLRIDILPVALVTPCEINLPTIHRSFQSGADVVIASIGGLLGGPESAVIIGRQSAIQSLQSHRLYSLFRADTATTAMALAALSRNPMDVNDSAAARMVTSIENLQSRADRIVTRLAGEDVPVQASVREEAAFIAPGMFPLQSRQVVLKMNQSDVGKTVDALRMQDPSVMSIAEGDKVILDLRWVGPDQDASIKLTR